MNGYYKPWRRKLGVVTLALACVLMFGWMRSIVYGDLIAIPTSKHSAEYFISCEQRIGWTSRCTERESELPKFTEWKTYSWAKSDEFFREQYRNPDSDVFQFCGFLYKYTETSPNEIEIFRAYPYWPIVIPLTLLSAWLLLSKPRQPKLVPPIAESSR